MLFRRYKMKSLLFYVIDNIILAIYSYNINNTLTILFATLVILTRLLVEKNEQ
jgi:hypothetical protein